MDSKKSGISQNTNYESANDSKSWKTKLLANPALPNSIKSNGHLQSEGDFWNGFNVTKDGMFIISTKYRRDIGSAPRGKACELDLCNAVVAIAYTKIYPARTWQKETLDQILIDGNNFYKSYFRRNPNHKTFTLESETQLTIKDFDVSIEAETHIISGQRELAIFLRRFHAGVVKYQHRVYAIWKDEEDAYYFFNPAAKFGTNLNTSKDATCTLFRSIALSGVLKIFIHTLKNTEADAIEMIYIDILKIEKDLGKRKAHRITESRSTEGSDSEIELKSATDTLSRLDRLISAENRLLNEIDGRSLENTAFKRPPSVKEIFDTNKKEFTSPVKAERETSQAHFTNISSDIGILRGTKHVYNYSKGADLIQSANTLAILMLRIKNSSFWNENVMDELLDKTFEVCSHDPKNIITNVKLHDRNFEISPSEIAVVGQLNSKNDKILDLNAALLEFFAKSDYGIIQGPNTVSIWHEGDFYYMYDPSECDENGNRIIRLNDNANDSEKLNDKINDQAKNLPNSSNVTGAACLMSFKSVKDLAKAYRNNIPPDKRQSNFFVSIVHFIEQNDVLTAWNNFKGISKDTWLLRGTISQSSPKFSGETRNHQSPCNAAVAIAFSKIYDPKFWTKDEVNEILFYGDEFCKKCIQTSAEACIKLDNLSTDFTIKTSQVSFDIEHSISGVISEEGKFIDLREGIHDFFSTNDAGILTARDISLALWKDSLEDVYYYFDSFPRDERGRQKEGGTSCVMRSTDMDNLINVIESNIPPERNNNYSLSRVNIKLWPMPQEKPDNIPPESFTKIQDGAITQFAILRSGMHEGHSKFENRKNRQTICNLAQAMAVSTLLPTSGWDSNTLTNILIDGDSLFDEILSKEAGSDHFKLTLDNFEHPIKLGTNIIELELSTMHETVFLTQENLTGDVLDSTGSLRYILESYFDDSEQLFLEPKYAFMLSDAYTVALWKEGSNIFMFDPKACDAKGTPSPTRLKQARQRHKNSKNEKMEESTSSTNEEEDQYSACVLWFDSVLYLLMKILTNVPAQCVEQEVQVIPIKFQINLIHSNSVFGPRISDTELESVRNWNEFKEIERGLYVIRANISQNSELFKEVPNRDNQDVPNSISAVIFANCYSCRHWDCDTLDVILKFGDRLYGSTYDKRRYKEEHTSGPWRYKIKPTHIAKKLLISDYKITLDLSEEVIKGDIKATHNVLGVLNLSKALTIFFDRGEYFFVLVTCKYYSVAIWIDSEGFFFLFDPHECGPNGRYQVGGTACCVRSNKLQKLIDIFTRSISNYINCKEVDASNGFTMHGLGLEVEKSVKTSKSKRDDGNLRNTLKRTFSHKFPVGVAKSNEPEINKAMNRNKINKGVEESKVLYLVDTNNKKLNEITTPHKQERNCVLEAIRENSKESLMTKIKKGHTIYSENLETISPPEYFLELMNENLEAIELPGVTDQFSTIEQHIKNKILKPMIVSSEISILETIPEEIQDEDTLIQSTQFTNLKDSSKQKEKSIMSYILEELPIENSKKSDIQPLPLVQTFPQSVLVKSPSLQITKNNKIIPNKRDEKSLLKKSINRSLPLVPTSTRKSLVKPPSRITGKMSSLSQQNQNKTITKSDCESTSSKKSESTVVTTIIEEEIGHSELHNDDQSKYSDKPSEDGEDFNDSLCKYATVGTQVSRKRIIVVEPNLARKIGRGFSVLRGNTSLTTPGQQYFQPGPQVLIAISLAYLKDSSTWTPTDLDEINISGNELMKKSLKNLSEPFDPLKNRLHVTKVLTDFTIRDQKVHVEVKGAFVRGRMDLNLHDKIIAFFQNYNSGVLNTAVLVLGVWKYKNVFYLFNCFPCDAMGSLQPEGMNCLMSFEKLDSLYDSVMGNLQVEEKEYAFSIRPVTVKMSESTKAQSSQKELEPVTENLLMYVKSIYKLPPRTKVWNTSASTRSFGFIPYCEGGEILRTRTSHLSYEHQILPVCIAAIIIAIIKKMDRWNETTLNKVIITGRKLYREWTDFFNDRDQDDFPANSALKSCRIEGKTVDVDVKSSIEEGYLFLEELIRAFQDFFFKEETGIFWAGMKFIVMKRDQRYYCFDAVSGCNPYVMRFDNLKHLTAFVYAKCLKNSEPGATLRRFNISSVWITECI